LVLPDDWVGVPASEAGKQELLAALRVSLADSDLPVARREEVIRAAQTDLSSAFVQARANGVSFVGSLAKPIDDTLVLIASVNVATISGAEVASAIGIYGELLTSTEHDSVDLFEFPEVGTGVRVVTGDLDPPHPVLLSSSPLTIQFHLPVPDRGGAVVITFATPNGVLRRQFGELFDSIARSLRFDE
jgi:hypothetical protein